MKRRYRTNPERRCNNCNYHGDFPVVEEKYGTAYVQCPECHVVQIIPTGEMHCDWCYGQPVVASFILNPYDVPEGMGFRIVQRIRTQASCLECTEDIKKYLSGGNKRDILGRLSRRAVSKGPPADGLRRIPSSQRDMAKRIMQSNIEEMHKRMIEAIFEGPTFFMLN